MSDTVPGPMPEPLTERATGRHRVSPRTAEYPMAFTLPELLRGAAIAWGVFQLLGPIACVVGRVTEGAPGGVLVGLYSEVLILPFSVAALMLLGIPAAWSLGFVLRHLQPKLIHVACFALLGALVSTTTTFIYGGFSSLIVVSSSDTDAWDLTRQLVLIFAMPCAVATAFGWWCTASLALRQDARAA